MTVFDLPLVNALLNSCATLFLLLGFGFIKKQQIKPHVVCMVTALVFSAAFLSCYLYYHFHAGHVKFGREGFIKAVYLFILFTHIPLAVVNLPMIVMTLIPAFQRRFDKHKRWAPWTLGVWLYVSITGVLVYLMCYVWFGPPVMR